MKLNFYYLILKYFIFTVTAFLLISSLLQLGLLELTEPTLIVRVGGYVDNALFAECRHPVCGS